MAGLRMPHVSGISVSVDSRISIEGGISSEDVMGFKGVDFLRKDIAFRFPTIKRKVSSRVPEIQIRKIQEVGLVDDSTWGRGSWVGVGSMDLVGRFGFTAK